MTTLKKLLLATVLSTATLLAGFSTVDCTNQAHLDILKLPQVECEALEALWDATDGPNWTDTTNWDTLTYADTWSGVYMHDDNSSIKWFGWGGKGNNLVGQLPEDIGKFVNLEKLVFTRDALTGEVPLSINNLHSLKALQLTETQLSGPLPKLSLFSNLYFINFIGNHFTGSIPTSYGTLTKLTTLLLTNNQLTGPLPDLGQLSVIEYFRIEKNNFTFSDIEPQSEYFGSDLTDLTYHHQAPINESNHPIVYFDDTLSITPSLAPNPSHHDWYTWKKKGVVLDANRTYVNDDYSASRIYVKEHATQADEGCYNYDVNNSVLTRPNHGAVYTYLVLHSSTCIQAVYDNAPKILNQTPQTTVDEHQPYTYTSNISDVDNDDLNVSVLALPTWLTFSSDDSSFTLTGTPSYTDAGTYDINITVTDGKVPVYLNYVLTVEQNIPAGYTAENNSYTHDATDTSIAIGSPYYYSFPEVDANDNIELYSNSDAWRNVYEGLTPEGILTTGYFNNEKGTSKTPTLSTPYPLGSKATLLEEPNSAEHQPMIMVEIPLGNGSIIVGE